MKSVQCGITTIALVIMFVECFTGKSVLYVLPSKTFKEKFIPEKIDGAIEKSPFYRSGLGKVDNRGLKQLWGGFLNVAGSNVPDELTSHTAQVAIIDELELCNPKYLPLVDDRLTATMKLTGKPPRRIDISNPTLVGNPIAIKYEESDQREWQVPCPHCGHEQPLDWFRVVVERTDQDEYVLRDKEWTPDCGRDINLICTQCNKPLDRYGDGRWFIKYPGRDVHGYHIHKLLYSHVKISELWKKFKKALNNIYEMQVFYNSDLGLPYSNEGFQITPGLLAACVDPGYKMPAKCDWGTFGVDIGKDVHVRASQYIDGKRYPAHIGHFVMDERFFENLLFICKTFGLKFGVIDAGFETSAARNFQKKARAYGITVYLCRFPKGHSIKEAKPDQMTGEIGVDRTQFCDALFDSYRNGDSKLPPNFRDLDGGDWLAQICIEKRVQVEDLRGNKTIEWEHPEGSPDHYFFAEGYDNLAGQLCHYRKKSRGIVWLD